MKTEKQRENRYMYGIKKKREKNTAERQRIENKTD